ncbi:MAG: hypothetical protein NT093_03940 [Candidatus Moranbacteria bacterium]|nr:hypothetical protein [Candidatus Moranbacteria bacterium]
MENRQAILQSLEDLNARAHELTTPEKIGRFISGMPISIDLRIHLYSNLAEAGFISAPLAATGWSGFDSKKGIRWVIEEIKKEIGEE